MKIGFQFSERSQDLDFRIFYTSHFVQRYEVGEPERNRSPVKDSVDEITIVQKIREALPQIAEIAYGDPDAEGVIVSEHKRFIMVFALIEMASGYQLNLITTSPSLKFKAKSAKDYTIKVNPIFEVFFEAPLSYALKVGILADIESLAMDLEDQGTFHLGGDLMDYWVERTGPAFYVFQADWAMPVHEVHVS